MSSKSDIPLTKERIVIIGGGFAGLNLVKRLDKKRFEIILVDRNNFHSFPPLFYQIASSGLDPGSISFPFRREMRKERAKGAHFHLGEVKGIDLARKELHTQFETLQYDRLIISAGTTNNFFGQPDLVKYVYTMKSASESIRIRDEVLDRLERASLTHDAEVRRRLLSFTVIGGGPTGVEVAGALGEMKRDIITREYPGINPDEVKITILEGTDKLLGTMSPMASRKALDYLKELMVDVKLSHLMVAYDNNIVRLDDGTEFYSEMVIWTAGVTGVSFNITGGELPIGRGNRIEVDTTNQVKGLEGIYALGDICIMTDDAYPKGHPQLAQVAIQQAKNLAANINNDTCRAFRYRDKGSMATVGRNLAVVDMNHFHLYGWPAWLTWMFVHLISLLGMRNKVTVLINWMWAYFTYNTSLRQLIHTTRYPLRSRWGER